MEDGKAGLYPEQQQAMNQLSSTIIQQSFLGFRDKENPWKDWKSFVSG